MTVSSAAFIPPLRSPPASLRQHGYALLYWLLFLLVLEPGNVFRANQAGITLDLSSEILRISLASLLGATVTPLLLRLTERFPVLGTARWRHLPIHSVGVAGLALALIVASCLLAAWVYEHRWLPPLGQVNEHLSANYALVVYALAAYTVIAHVAYLVRLPAQRERYGPVGACAGVGTSARDGADDTETGAERSGTGPRGVEIGTEKASSPCEANTCQPAAVVPYLVRVKVNVRGRPGYLELSDVDWIETQGNYLALHAGADVHLIRETLVKFETQLDPRHFVRIHRRTIVAIDRVLDMQPVANGDAQLLLTGGRELRASRSYRATLRECLDEAARIAGPAT